METKSEIRKRILQIRGQLTQDEVVKKSEAIIQQVLKTPEYQEADNVLLYADYNNEVMTKGLFENCIKHRKKVYFPKTDHLTGTMEFYRVISVQQLEKGFKGIPEPKEISENRYKMNKSEDTLVILPGVAFDINGYRVGYGKGYYDKYLSDKRQLSTIALAFACQIVDEVPYDEYDIKMDKVVTEEIIYSFLRV